MVVGFVGLFCAICISTIEYVGLTTLRRGAIIMERPFKILPAEYIGDASHGDDGILRIGTPDADGNGVVEIPLTWDGKPGWWNIPTIEVYVRRQEHEHINYDETGYTRDIIEIHMVRHDGLVCESMGE